MPIKWVLTAFLFLSISIQSFSQWANKSFTFGGQTRQYRIYVPAAYDPSDPASLVIALHGLGDNMTNFSNIGLHLIADTANFILLIPQAMNDVIAGPAWNSSAGIWGYYPCSSVNDIGFLNALADTASANYTIDPERVYMCGFSMGGFMTEKMACQSNAKFAAFASVAGTFGAGLPGCQPDRMVPVAHFHGTSDNTVGFADNNYGCNADSLVNFWAGNNACSEPPVHSDLPNLQADGYTVEHLFYDGAADVEFFRINGADHVWLTAANDISYSAEIWKFFNKHRLSDPTGVADIAASGMLTVHPNPAEDQVTIGISGSAGQDMCDVRIFNALGGLIWDKKEVQLPFTFSSNLFGAQGVLFVHVSSGAKQYTARLLVNR